MFSVVIPLYNKEDHIFETVESVLGQEYSDFELIIVDDGSTDKSLEIVQSISDERLKLVSQENAGEGAARNRGIREANREFIAFLDADDYWKENHLAVLKRLIEKFPKVGIYASNYQIKNKQAFQRPDFAYLKKDNDQKIVNYFEVVTDGDQIVNSSNSCIPKQVFKKIGFFKENEPLGTDLDMWGRIALEYDIAFTREISSVYNQEAINRSCELFVSKRELPFGRYLRNEYGKPKDPDNDLRHAFNYINKLLIERASANIKLGEKYYARKLLKRYEGDEIQKKYFWLIMSYLPVKLTKQIQQLYRKIKYSWK